MKPGRNDPCPCGSGRKYKHCCQLAGRVSGGAPADLVWRRLRRLLDEHQSRMLRFVEDTYGPAALGEAWEEFTLFEEVEFDPRSPLMPLFLPWFFHRWTPDAPDTAVADESLHEARPTELYLARKGRGLDPLLRGYLESCLSAPFSYFEILDSEPGRGFRARDVMTGEEHEVTERAASRALERGDIVFGQVATVNRLTLLEAGNGFSIPPIEMARIVEVRARLRQAVPVLTRDVLIDYDLELLELFHDIAGRVLEPKMPRLQNTDGEPISPRTLVFDLDVPVRAAFDALKHLAFDETEEDLLADAVLSDAGELARVTITWKKPGNKMHASWDNTVLGTIVIDGARLTAEVNSEGRAQAARREIETALAGRVRFRLEEIQSVEQMLADARAAGAPARPANAAERERLAELPEVRAKLAEMMAAHFESWVEQPLPALGGRTPLDAVTDPDLREVVESLVIEAERHGRRMSPPTDEAVFRRLRERLGL